MRDNVFVSSTFLRLLAVAFLVAPLTAALTGGANAKSGQAILGQEAKPAASPSLSSLSSSRSSQRQARQKTDYSAFTQAGDQVNLSQVRGWKVVYFWSSACPCVASCQKTSIAPLVRKYQNEQGKVRFFAIASNAANLAYETQEKREPGDGAAAQSLGTNDRAQQQERVTLSLGDVAEQKPPPGCPLLLDPHHRLADSLKATHTPQAFLLSPDNRVLFRGDPDNSVEVRARTGKEGVTRRYLADAIRQALAGKKVARPVAPLLGCEIDRSDASTGSTSNN